jgi:putative phosphoribosyl transferase
MAEKPVLEVDESLIFPAGRVELEGDLVIPTAARGIVVFAHGSGSSRHSKRNRIVARTLQQRGLGTLLFDLLTPDEAASDAVDAHLRFDIPLLAQRLAQVASALERSNVCESMPIGYFGASTGAAAALVAAGRNPESVRAVVSRGGRPDLAGSALALVRAPTLLIVGGDDHGVLTLNRRALAELTTAELQIVPGATHLFEEPGALERVAALAASWFTRYL